MDSAAFQEMSGQMAAFIGEYLDTIRQRRVTPCVQPGFLRPLLPVAAPQQADQWQAVLADVEAILMPGMTHWQSPRFHAYFPAGCSYPSIVADMLCGALACTGITWVASPACTELEVVMLDWLAKMLGLPEHFLASSPGKGGGVIQGSASESTLVALLGAKARAIRRAKIDQGDLSESDVVGKLVAYASSQAHTSVRRAALLAGVRMTLLPTDDRNALRGETLVAAMLEDRRNGLIPFYVVATLGTTASCAFDALREIGALCDAQRVWLHVDAAYAGAAFVCPEFRFRLDGVQCADSFNFNPHKWMLVGFDCSAMWFKDPSDLVDAYKVDAIYLTQDDLGDIPEYRNWQLPFGRRFRSLKLWFTLRLFGVDNIQAHIRLQVALAREFEELVRQDDRFEVTNEVTMGLVCFRLKGANAQTQKLLQSINRHGLIFLVPSEIRGVFFLRMAVCSHLTLSADIQLSWHEVRSRADELLAGLDQ